ncbi:ABC transporter ATP-binding protein [Cyanobium sp. NIES-981]|uniref:ABC transporter ATP-binding protein n=1 Tax=Cyanobium sp. NIES-981 TaxID=1851505 RepID=UPI0007DDEE6B|nr:ABC transporter ATP-binding protein [Cyanobium sp. NIES-981]SBO44020.1 putative Teichoic-acid-transporting ATPase [Cyanobium sp. NIES-981]
MANSDVVIRVEGLGKKYSLHHGGRESYTALRDVIARRARAAGRLLNPFTLAGQLQKARRQSAQARNAREEEFWALKDVSFEIRRGERVGIIGRNGAGKSTLLKILSRITEPTTGRVEISGRVASLLEVGTGFHPELTGRENIYLNGAILGMTRREICGKFDEIVDFAEVERFLDTPVKRYSSGMYVRLAFSVAAHLEPEILFVDEVLSVGDAGFQKKCLGKMKDTSATGRSLLYVSHNLSAVSALCKNSILLSQGNLSFAGATANALKKYQDDPGKLQKRSSSCKFFDIISSSLELIGTNVLQINLALLGHKEGCSCYFAFDIRETRYDLVAGQAFTYDKGPHRVEEGFQLFSFTIKLPNLVPGHYDVSCWIGSYHTSTFISGHLVGDFSIITSPTRGRLFPHTIDHGLIVFDIETTRVSQYTQ